MPLIISSVFQWHAQAGEEDINFDGKPDVITFIANLQSSQPVYGIKALVQFTYSFNVSVRRERLWLGLFLH